MGAINTPYVEDRPKYDTDKLLRCHKVLYSGSTDMSDSRFDNYREFCGDGFYFIDPPYDKTYDSYSSDVITQEKIASQIKRIHEVGGLFMTTNSDTPKVRELYRDYNIISLDITYSVGATGSKKTRELIIRNY